MYIGEVVKTDTAAKQWPAVLSFIQCLLGFISSTSALEFRSSIAEQSMAKRSPSNSEPHEFDEERTLGNTQLGDLVSHTSGTVQASSQFAAGRSSLDPLLRLSPHHFVSSNVGKPRIMQALDLVNMELRGPDANANRTYDFASDIAKVLS